MYNFTGVNISNIHVKRFVSCTSELYCGKFFLFVAVFSLFEDNLSAAWVIQRRMTE
jgi:hypothetical protein